MFAESGGIARRPYNRGYCIVNSAISKNFDSQLGSRRSLQQIIKDDLNQFPYVQITSRLNPLDTVDCENVEVQSILLRPICK